MIMDNDFEDFKPPRKRAKLTSWLLLLLFPVALILPSTAENVRLAIIGHENVCCDPENREELEKRAESAREHREQADLIMKVGIIGGGALAIVTALLFVAKVALRMPGILKIVFLLVAVVAAGYVCYTTYRMWTYYTQNTEDYYGSDAWDGFRNLGWYLPTEW